MNFVAAEPPERRIATNNFGIRELSISKLAARPAALFPISLALGAIILTPGAGAREPTQLRKCQTISQPGSYELADNLTANGDCLVITADFAAASSVGYSPAGS